MHSCMYTVQLKAKENTALNPKGPISDVKNVMSIFLLAQFQLYILKFFSLQLRKYQYKEYTLNCQIARK